VAKSIEKYGFVQPVVVDADGVIVIGHCRVLAAKKLGMDEVPCVCVDDLTPEQVDALRIVDNKTNESDWDMDYLAEEAARLDFSEFDFDFGLQDNLTDTVVEDDFDMDVEVEPKAKLGDVYQLGEHRLMCGDSTSLRDVQKLAGGGTD
jgi:site-specific DNA-methyltransferase (adenine-specific)